MWQQQFNHALRYLNLCIFLGAVSAATCMVSPAVDEGRGLSKFFPLQNLFLFESKINSLSTALFEVEVCKSEKRFTREKKFTVFASCVKNNYTLYCTYITSQCDDVQVTTMQQANGVVGFDEF